jgi:hypothetical protein
VNLLAILRRKVPVPELRDWLLWGQSKVLQFPVPGTLSLQTTGQLVRAQRHPPTTWTVVTTFRFASGAGDFGGVQTLNWGVKYTLGVGQTQTDATRTFQFGNAHTFTDRVVLLVGGAEIPFGVSDFSGAATTGTVPNVAPTFVTHTVIEQLVAEDLQVTANVAWNPNALSGGLAQCTIGSFVAPVVY